MSEVIWKVSPAVTAAEEERAPDQRQLPEEALSQSDQCVYVSVAATLVHSIVAEEASEPDEAADQETDLRVVSVAAFEVPASPGSAVCNLTYVVVTANDWFLRVSSRAFSA